MDESHESDWVDHNRLLIGVSNIRGRLCTKIHRNPFCGLWDLVSQTGSGFWLLYFILENNVYLMKIMLIFMNTVINVSLIVGFRYTEFHWIQHENTSFCYHCDKWNQWPILVKFCMTSFNRNDCKSLKIQFCNI